MRWTLAERKAHKQSVLDQSMRAIAAAQQMIKDEQTRAIKLHGQIELLDEMIEESGDGNQHEA